MSAFEKYLQDCVQEIDPSWAKSCAFVVGRMRAARELHKELFGAAELPDPKVVVELYDRLLERVYASEVEPRMEEFHRLAAERDALMQQLTQRVQEIEAHLKAFPRPAPSGKSDYR